MEYDPSFYKREATQLNLYYVQLLSEVLRLCQDLTKPKLVTVAHWLHWHISRHYITENDHPAMDTHKFTKAAIARTLDGLTGAGRPFKKQINRVSKRKRYIMNKQHYLHADHHPEEMPYDPLALFAFVPWTTDEGGNPDWGSVPKELKPHLPENLS